MTVFYRTLAQVLHPKEHFAVHTSYSNEGPKLGLNNPPKKCFSNIYAYVHLLRSCGHKSFWGMAACYKIFPVGYFQQLFLR